MNGEQLRTIRRRIRLTQTALAEHIGVAANTVARWERGELPIPRHMDLTLEALEIRLSKINKSEGTR